MPVSREQLEHRERLTLAPYAQLSSDSRGRVHPEDPPQSRTQFQRDRDRIIHSRAFRRLEYKTQVFLNGSGDHLRTRLTHTIEVAGISRNIARALQLNEDLTEAIALAHDLGHAPFGHQGEFALDRLMRKHGGFEHNRHSLRIVELLEQKYPGFPGLNLTWEVREGLCKHSDRLPDAPNPPAIDFKQPSLEAQIANFADSIAYYSHDLDDGLDSGLLKEEHLLKEVELWKRAAQEVRKRFGKLPDECRRYYTIRTLIDGQVRAVVEFTEARIARARIGSSDDVRRQARMLVGFTPERRRWNLQLRKYLYRNLYYNPVVHQPNRRAVRALSELADHLLENPSDATPAAQGKAKEEGLHRALCDYLAGMTDLYCLQEHERLLGRRAYTRRGSKSAVFSARP